MPKHNFSKILSWKDTLGTSVGHPVARKPKCINTMMMMMMIMMIAPLKKREHRLVRHDPELIFR